MTKFQVAGTYDGEYFSVIISMNDTHAISLDGLSKDNMLELQSCIDCMLSEEQTDGIGTTS